MTNGVEFRILGLLEVAREAGAVQVSGRKHRALLAVLLVHANQVVSADRLVEALWNESPPPSAANTLQGYVSHLRRAVGSGLILTRPPGYLLAVERAAVDAGRFERLVVEGRAARAAGDPARAARLLEDGDRLWRGPALAEFVYDPFAQPEATRLEELRLGAAEELADALLALGRHEEVLGHIRSLAREHPLRERLWGQLAVALYRSGRQGEALRAFGELRRHLREELGIEPSPAVCGLEDDVLHQRASLEAPAAPRPGVLRVADNLPVHRSSFVGREAELDQLRRLATAGGLLTIVGPGGAGKTRLSVEVAHRVAADYPDGAWLVELASWTDPSLVPVALAAALGVPDQPGKPVLESVADSVAAKRMLVVLDNCEHVADAAAAAADAILRRAQEVTIVATSREPLRVEGEVVWRTPPLPAPPEDVSSEAASTFAAVELFCARAAAHTSFRLDDANVGAVAQLVRRLDGLPLAIELAAARAGALSPAEMLAHLDQRFALLSQGRRTAPDRHRTLRAAADWSYDLLSATEQTLFGRLAVFAGGFGMEAAEYVCGRDGFGADAFVDLLASLVEKSLVVAEETNGVARYRLLETLRAYGAERLAHSGEEQAVRKRHLRWYAGVAAAAPAFVGAVTQHSADPRRDQRDNLRQALEWALESGDVATAVSIVDTCGLPYVRDGWALVDRVVEASTSASPRVRAEALLIAGTAANSRADFPTAVALRREALAIFDSLDDQGGVAVALHYLAAAAMAVGRHEEALATYEGSLDAWRRAGLERTYGSSLNYVHHNLGVIGLQTGRLDEARAHLEKALALADKLGEEGGTSVHLCALGEVDEAEGKLDAARRRHEESLALARGMGFSRSVTENLMALARIAAGRGDRGSAARMCVEALAVAMGEADPVGMIRGVIGVASLASARGEALQAALLLGAVHASQEAIGLRPHVAERSACMQAEAACRAALGEHLHEDTFASGTAWSLEQAASIATTFALGEDG